MIDLRIQNMISEGGLRKVHDLGEIKRDRKSNDVKLIDPNQPLVKNSKPYSGKKVLGSGTANNTGAGDLLRFRLESDEGVDTTAAFGEALQRFQAVCDLYPYNDEMDQSTKVKVCTALSKARDEFLSSAELHFRAMGVKVTNTGEALQIEPDPTTIFGRYASRAKRHGAASVHFYPFMKLFKKDRTACFSQDSSTIWISFESARSGRAGKSEGHEFIHAVMEHYCGDLGGNSAFYGKIQADEGYDLFPDWPDWYNRAFSLDETVAYAYNTWWAARDLKDLRDQFVRGEVENLEQFVADLKSSFQEWKGYVDDIGNLSVKSGKVAMDLAKEFVREHDDRAVEWEFTHLGLKYGDAGSASLDVEFRLASEPGDDEILWVICRNPREHNSLKIKITDPRAIRILSRVCDKKSFRRNDEKTARKLDRVAHDFVLPRVNATSNAAIDCCRAFQDELYPILQDVDAVMADLSPATLAGFQYREKLFESLDTLFTNTRSLRNAVRKHSRS